MPIAGQGVRNLACIFREKDYLVKPNHLILQSIVFPGRVAQIPVQ